MNIKRLSLYILITGVIFSSCKPQKGKDKDLPAPSSADFVFERKIDPADPDDKNTYTFRNTTPGVFITSWDFGGVAKSKNPNETVFFGYKGTYKIKLLTTSAGGTTTITKDLVIEENSPYAADFTIENVNDYTFKVTSTTPGPQDLTFKYANGDSSKSGVSTVYFPFKGSYDISLKVKTAKGSSTITKQVNVANDDLSNPDLNDPIVKFLTGGLDAPNGKTWVMVSAGKSGGVGPLNTLTPDWWDQPMGFGGDAWDKGMLSNEFTFNLRQYQYTPKSNNVTVHWNFAKELTGSARPKDQDTYYSDPKHTKAPFIIRNANSGVGTGYTLDFGNGSYLGYYDRRYNHDIVRISADTLYIRHHYNDDPTADPAGDGGVRYFTLVPKK
ncbi:MAG: hypothetical protein NVV82_08965 [Sporocytophaga sp.]|nr:hypothetical protein [Sporocytophaga sp.]